MLIPTLTAEGLLGKTALEAVKTAFQAKTFNALDPNQVDYVLQPETSSLKITGRAVARDGSDGQFVGDFTIAYTKVPIAKALPHPILMDIDYPCNFALIRTTLLQQYGIVIEENELALTPSGAGLSDTSYLTAPANDDNIVTLYTSSQSGRFIAGDPVRFIAATVNGARSLNQTLGLMATPSADSLLYSANSVGNLTLFSATDDEFVRELLMRQFGEAFPASDLSISLQPVDHYRTVAVLTPQNANPVWRGYGEFWFKKASLTEALPELLVVNMSYPTDFKPLAHALKTAYGFVLPPGEFALLSPEHTALGLFDRLDAPLDSDGYLSLYVTEHSARWVGRETLRLQFVKSVADQGEDLFGGAPPNGTGGTPYFFRYTPVGMHGLIDYRVVRGTAPVLLTSDGVYTGTPTSGEYLWTVRTKDVTGATTFRTERVTVA